MIEKLNFLAGPEIFDRETGEFWRALKFLIEKLKFLAGPEIFDRATGEFWGASKFLIEKLKSLVEKLASFGGPLNF